MGHQLERINALVMSNSVSHSKLLSEKTMMMIKPLEKLCISIYNYILPQLFPFKNCFRCIKSAINIECKPLLNLSNHVFEDMRKFIYPQ